MTLDCNFQRSAERMNENEPKNGGAKRRLNLLSVKLAPSDSVFSVYVSAFGLIRKMMEVFGRSFISQPNESS